VYKGLANLVSYVFHPLILSTLLIVVLFFFAPALLQPINAANVYPVLGAIFVLTFVIPIFSVGMLKLTKSISSLKLENHKERFMPFFFIAVYYGLTAYLFAYKLQLSEVIVVIFSATSAVIFIVAIVSLGYRISAHSAGAWGIVGYLVSIHFKFSGGELLYPLIGSIIIAGLISSSRLALNSHKPSEVYLGGLLGFIICFSSIFIFT